MSTLFFLHIPKCAGMSLMDALLDRLPAGQVYQSTSMVRNIWENRPDFLQITHHRGLKAVVGHWVHEAMLPVLQKPIYFASSLRHPVQRVKSQFRFDMGIRGGDWPKRAPDGFLESNSNVIVNFATRAFPTIAADFDDPADAAKAIFSGMDMLFDVADADKRLGELATRVTGTKAAVPRVNESGNIDAELPFSDDQIAEHCAKDMAVYDWFSAARQERPQINNPVFDADVRDRFAQLGGRSFNPDVLADFLVTKLADEIRFGTQDPQRILTAIQAGTGFSLKLERKLMQRLAEGQG